MRIIGLDLSLASTGMAEYTPGGVTVSRITSKPGAATLPARADRIDRLAADIVHQCKPADLIVIEGPSLGQARQAGQHDRAGLWWIIVADLHGWGRPVAEVPPALVKQYATGKGNASKDTVLAAVIRRYPTVEVTGNDQADALVLAAMGADHYQCSTLPTVPQTHRAALAKVAWPTRGEAAA